MIQTFCCFLLNVFTKVISEVVDYMREKVHIFVLYLGDGMGCTPDGNAPVVCFAYSKYYWEVSLSRPLLDYNWHMADGVIRISSDMVQYSFSDANSLLTAFIHFQNLFFVRRVV